jgi:hypothetical protein
MWLLKAVTRDGRTDFGQFEGSAPAFAWDSQEGHRKLLAYRVQPPRFGTRLLVDRKEEDVLVNKLGELIWIWSNQVIPRGTTFLEKLIVTHLVRNSPAFYGTQRFIRVLIRSHRWTPFRSIPSHLVPPGSVLILCRQTYIYICIYFQ